MAALNRYTNYQRAREIARLLLDQPWTGHEAYVWSVASSARIPLRAQVGARS
jgi:hypothetical protein